MFIFLDSNPYFSIHKRLFEMSVIYIIDHVPDIMCPKKLNFFFLNIPPSDYIEFWYAQK